MKSECYKKQWMLYLIMAVMVILLWDLVIVH